MSRIRWAAVLIALSAIGADGVAFGQTQRTTLAQFEQAGQVATIAANHAMHALSLRAIRSALIAGPPVDQAALSNLGRLGVRTSAANRQPTPTAAIERQVLLLLEQLDQLWLKTGAPPAEVYATLSAVVLPEQRPGEITLYVLPLNESGIVYPASVGRLLARWAARADKAADLQARIEARQAQPLAEAPARVLLAQLADATNDEQLARRCVDWFEQRLAADSLEINAELAVHALPQLQSEELSDATMALLEAIVRAKDQRPPQTTEEHSYAAAVLWLAKLQLARGDVQAARRQLDKFLARDDSQNSRYSGDYGVYRRFEQFHAVVRELLAAGATADALEYLARAADLPRTTYSGNSIGPALAQLSRQLAERPALERYKLLKSWTMPEPNRRSVRVMTGFVAPDAIPANWQSGWRKNARDGSLALGANLASTATMLIDAAREAGQLDDLAQAARAAAAEKCENGEVFSWIVEVSRGVSGPIEPQLRKWIEDRRTSLPAQNDRNRMIPWLDYQLARACLADEKVRPLGEEAAGVLIAHSQRIQDHLFMSQCRADLWAGIAERETAARDPAARIAAAEAPDLALWTPASHQTAATHRGGSASAWWVAHEGHVAHAGGPDHEFLYFNYPLTGKFAFTAEIWEGGFGEGNVSYGGLVFEGLHFGMQTQIWPVGKSEVVWLPDPLESVGAFHQFTIDVAPERTRCYVNGHLLYEDSDPSPTSPWLALFSNRLMQTVYRNLQISGSPQIPREVRLTHGDRMEGWISSFYGDTQPPRRSIGRSDQYGRNAAALNPDLDAYDWHAAEGALFGRRAPRLSRTILAESRLYYHRPLRNGETISYEFLYEPGLLEVHPALDRLTFLLEPAGMRLHWMTDGSGSDASGIDPHNVADDPGARRGPDRLPLKPGEWNRAQLSLVDDRAVLAINGTEVFRRPLEADNDRLFGFFHYRAETAVQVRNVVLTGDWPESLATQAQANLALANSQPVDIATRRARHAIVDEKNLSQNAWNVWREARKLPPEQRYALLLDWVLPNDDHPTFRLRGDFTPGNPAPPVAGEFLLAGEQASSPRSVVGGRLAAPAIDLVATAKELGRLDDLARRIASAPAEDDVRQRGRLALGALVALARGDEAEAGRCLEQMLPLLRRIDPHAAEHERWPELIAATAALDSPALRHSARVLAELMVVQNFQNYVGRDWEQHIRHLRGAARWKLHPDAQKSTLADDPPLAQWKRVTLASAETQAKGYPPPRWRAADGALDHVPGHRGDLMYFAVPLRGDFQVEAQLTSFSWRETELIYNGLRLVLRPDLKHHGMAQFGWILPDAVIDPPLAPLAAWYDFRLEVNEGAATAYINGRPIHQERLPAEPDPWLAIYCEGHYDGAIRNVRITGRPTVPEELNLSSATDLAHWHSYYGEPLTGDAAAWKKSGDEIEARRLTGVEGSLRESLLQYHRPLLEDGEIEYEFYYEPGQVEVYPCLDRMALVLAPQGVDIHWLTDAQFERSGLWPDNLSPGSQGALHSAPAPLKPRAWNRAKLSLTGDKLALEINGADVYRGKLEASNQRVFGFFHYADQTAARVRGVRYRGQWPRSLPALGAQELAIDPIEAAALDEQRLARRLSFDFRGAELDPRYFRPSNELAAEYLHASPDGLRIELTAGRPEAGDAGLASQFGLGGDFEVETKFEILKATQPATGAASGFDLHVQLAGTDDHAIIERRLLADGRNVINCGHGLRGADGEYHWFVGQYAHDAKAGRHKLVRNGAVVFYFFAADDGPLVLYDQQTVGVEDVKFIELLGRAFDRQSSVEVLIRQFTVRAEQLLGLAEEKQP